MKYFEIGVVILIFASVLRTCSYDNDVSDKELCNQFFSHNFPDETISVVRTRRLYSYSPLQWENPTSADELIWEKSEWMSMSNMYAIVVIDRRVSRWVFKLTDEYCPFFGNEMKAIRNTCEYNVKDDTLKPSDAVANSVWQMKDCGNDGCEIVDLEKMFNRYTSCPCIYFGNGENGVLFWRGGTQGFQMMRPSRLSRAWLIICDRVFMPPPVKRRDSRQSAPFPPPRRGHAATALGRTCPSCRFKGSCAARTCGASRRTRP